MAFKLGRVREPNHLRTKLFLGDYLYDASKLPVVPLTQVVDYATKVTSSPVGWPMYGNDAIGDCTCAAFGHMIQSWTAYAGKPEVIIPPVNIVSMYSAISGYNPSTGAHDDGCVMQDVLEYMRQTGLKDSAGKTHKVVAYAALRSFTDATHLGQILKVYGSIYTGFNLPVTAIPQTNAGKPWSYTPGAAIDGGHCVPLQRRLTPASVGMMHYVTWGLEQAVTRPFVQNYAEEAWVVITEDFMNAHGETPAGYDLAALTSDMHLVS